MMKTTTATLSRQKQAITWAMLSKTFQDAIIITHELGLRYIWIDSLCIIQDDTSDWEEESKKMAAIYGNSKVTIAAVKSKDGDGGCFMEIDKFVFFTHPTSSMSIAIRKLINHDEYRVSGANMDKLPLFSRGWTYKKSYWTQECCIIHPWKSSSSVGH